jgi:diguanylate cyclase (GGDEF)-like protein
MNIPMTTAARTAVRRARLFGLRPLRLWLFIGAVATASAGVWAFNLDAYGPRPDGAGISLPWWGLAVAFFVAEAWVVHLQFRKQAHTLSLTEIGLVLGLFFASPEALLVAQVVGAGLALAVLRRQKPVKLTFNVAELALCSGVALVIFRSFTDPGTTSIQVWGVVLLAAAAAHAVGVLLVSSVIAVAERTWSAPQLPQTLVVSLMGSLATASLGLVAVVLVENQPLAGLLLVLPAITCVLSFRAYMSQREQREHVEFLYESMRATQGAPEFGLAVGELLVAARRLLRTEYAEIILLNPTESELVLRSASGAAGELLMHPEALTPVAELAVNEAGAADRALVLARRRETHPLDHFLASRGLADAMIGALRGDERVFGVLIVGDRMGEATTFGESDLALFETFTGHASVLLENGRLERSLEQVTELKEELRTQAYHDALTGLPNRVNFAERVEETLARETADGTAHAVLFLDLDRFKIVNDSWGHSAGDKLLVQVAERIRRAVRPGDTPARLGGDEFAVLLENTDALGAEAAAQRLVDAFGAAFTLSNREANVHASIGIALTGPHAKNAEELLRNADIAMYTAKSDEHRRYALYEPILHSRLRRRRQLALELEQAIEAGEIVPYFQPVVSLADGTIQAFEALARWIHPERGVLPPAAFLSVAEESGLIVEVDSTILAQAVRCASEWQDTVPEAATLGLWVNVAPGSLTSERLVTDLAYALTRARLDVQRVTVEITESSVIRDEHGALKAMQRLRELGVRLSLDDFGTGYSSLSRLAEFPIEMLKVPKPFVDRLAGADRDTSFVDAILRLAGSLGLAAVGEGIEHAAQARQLRDLGCGLGQGFLFSPPVPAEGVFRLLDPAPADRGAFSRLLAPVQALAS